MPDFARAQARRQRANFALFLGPALVLLLLFFVAPIVIDLVLAFTDMGRTLAVTKFTLENFERMVSARHAPSGGARHHGYLRGDNAGHIQRHLCSAAGIGDDCRAATPRRVLSRGVAAAADEPVRRVCAAVAVGGRPQRARAAQSDRGPCLRSAAGRSSQQSSADGDHPGERLHRRVPRHAHLHVGHPLDSRAPLPRRPRRRCGTARHRAPHHASGVALADLLHDDPSDALAARKLRVRSVDHRRWSVLRHHGLLALRLSARVRER